MQIRYKNGNNSFGMRAAIAKRFSGDAAPELFRFFRISIGSGCEACACLGGAQRRRLVSKTVTYFYGHYIFMRKTAGTKECFPADANDGHGSILLL